MLREPLSWTTRMGLVYIILLALVIILGFRVYGYLFDVGPVPEAMDPESPLFVQFQSYGRYLTIASLMLGVFLGLFAANAGLKAGRWQLGLGLLVLGVLATAIPFSFLPHFHFPGGDMSPAMIWITTGFYAYTATWLGANLLGRRGLFRS